MFWCASVGARCSCARAIKLCKAGGNSRYSSDGALVPGQEQKLAERERSCSAPHHLQNICVGSSINNLLMTSLVNHVSSRWIIYSHWIKIPLKSRISQSWGIAHFGADCIIYSAKGKLFGARQKRGEGEGFRLRFQPASLKTKRLLRLRVSLKRFW